MKEPEIVCCDTGLVYRNSRPHLRSVHAWHPTVVGLDDGTMLCAFDLGEAVESLDYRTYASRSTDGGKTWSSPAAVFTDNGKRLATSLVRISRSKEGTPLGL